MMFPNPEAMGKGLLTEPRSPSAASKIFDRKVKRLGFSICFHDLRGTHSTLLLDHGVPVHVVAARCGQDPATLLRSYGRNQCRQRDRQHREGSFKGLKPFGSKLGPRLVLFS